MEDNFHDGLVATLRVVVLCIQQYFHFACMKPSKPNEK